MKKTRACEFSDKQRKAIKARDENQCIFCNMQYHMEEAHWLDMSIKSIMHYIPRSKGGLGIEQNGAVGCQWHHHMLDNGSSGLRKEMLEMFKEYLKRHYPDWDEKKLTYDKWAFLKENGYVYKNERN